VDLTLLAAALKGPHQSTLKFKAIAFLFAMLAVTVSAGHMDPAADRELKEQCLWKATNQ